MNTKNILTETLTCNDAWGKTRYATIEWIPKEVTGYDASLANVGIRTFAWDDQPPVFLVRAQHGQVRMVKNVLEVAALLDASPSGNVGNPSQYLESALTRLPVVQEHLDAHGQELAERIRESHRRVRTAAGARVCGLKVRPESPADVLGVYIFVPVPRG